MTTHTDTRTAATNRTPTTHQLAAELGVDASLLDDFVSHHPNPTTAIVLGWVNRHTDAPPDRHAADVEAWLGRRLERRDNRDGVTRADLPADRRLGPHGGGWR